MASDPPAKLSAEPYPVMPLIVKALACPASRILMVSPTAKWPARADARSIMTWPGPAAGGPLAGYSWPGTRHRPASWSRR